ncbi:AMP-binding protein [Paenibacillus sp. GSMTC-2017]|nr:AMP-binding protein [Paenibacillus sp. GSMTC-2017]MBH5318375.1 AMP-binding protein [Paenibacillus sp. GSMTC-2017]
MLSPQSLLRLFTAIYQYGINVMTLIKVAERTYGERTALIDDRETITYSELMSESERLTTIFHIKYGIGSGQKVGLLCRNHVSLVKSIFASSLAGSDIYLLNTEMSLGQLNQLLDAHPFDLIVYDEDLSALLKQSSYTRERIMSYHDHSPAINNLHRMFQYEGGMRKRTSSSTLMLLTGGTTGKAKKVAHKPSLFNYLYPFSALLTKLNLLKHRSAYIATPIYHGYGIAILLLCMALGKKVVLTASFNAAKACNLIREHEVEIVTVVPLMVHKMLAHNVADLKSLACIASGGAELSPKLVADVSSSLGDVLFNLYGTSEAGLNIVATPQHLTYSSITIGKVISGVRLKVLDAKRNKVADGTIGQLCVRNRWSMRNRKDIWIETGDLGYRDEQGYYFLRGRVDDMIVSAGENVYPIEIEQVLIHHPLIEDVAAVGVTDERFGQRLKVYVQMAPNNKITEADIMEWLRPRIARYQVPKEIVFVEQVPYTHLGKRNKKVLK